jgi:hypothetical protein
MGGLFDMVPVDIGGSMMAGQQARTAQQGQNALRQYAGAAMAGDQNALAMIAQYDPMLAFQLSSGLKQDARADKSLALQERGFEADEAHRDRSFGLQERGFEADQAYRADNLALARQAGARDIEAHGAQMTAADRENGIADLQTGIAELEAALPLGPEAVAAVQAGWGDEFPEWLRSKTPEEQLEYGRGMLDALAGPAEEPAAMQTLRLQADAAGLKPGTPAFEQFMAHGGIPRTMQLTTSPDGGVSFTEGPMNAGGVSQKPPTGYATVPKPDGTSALAPIEGGPATQMPAELAARIAVADDGLKVLPDLILKAENGDLTGIFDWAWGVIGKGEQGKARRDIKGASEAITRLLTGAGMNNTEIANEGWMYTPQLLDDAATVKHKLERLQDRLKSARDQASLGRSGAVGINPETGLGVPGQAKGGVRFRYDPETGEMVGVE